MPIALPSCYVCQSLHVRRHERLWFWAMGDLDEDFSASTARFQAFVLADQEQAPAWKMRASGLRIAALAGIVVVVAAVAAIIALGFV